MNVKSYQSLLEAALPFAEYFRALEELVPGGTILRNGEPSRSW
jgi:hypothetical protein